MVWGYVFVLFYEVTKAYVREFTHALCLCLGGYGSGDEGEGEEKNVTVGVRPLLVSVCSFLKPSVCVSLHMLSVLYVLLCSVTSTTGDATTSGEQSLFERIVSWRKLWWVVAVSAAVCGTYALWKRKNASH